MSLLAIHPLCLFLLTASTLPVFATYPAVVAGQGETHLFILSGQSNMAGLEPDESFTPAVIEAFGKDHVIVVKDAQGGQPIRRWYKNWRSPQGKAAEGQAAQAIGDLYDRLMAKVKPAIEGKDLTSVTFVWMQGERDAREKNAEVYAASLQGLLDQLSKDLGRKDLNVVVGRLSDFDMKNTRYPHWTAIRKVQTEFADAQPNRAWVDTDDLNDGRNRRGKEINNDLHYSADGYKVLGQRFADKAIELIKRETR